MRFFLIFIFLASALGSRTGTLEAIRRGFLKLKLGQEKVQESDVRRQVENKPMRIKPKKIFKPRRRVSRRYRSRCFWKQC